MTLDARLEAAMCGSLDSLLGALDLEAIGDGTFRARCETPRFDRVFGGQLLAQALVGAATTVTHDKQPQSLHASFVEGAVYGEPLEIAVERVRDGGSMSLRQVTLTQRARPVLVALASFHANATEPHVVSPPPPAHAPSELPLLQQLIQALPAEAQKYGLPWVEQPPPLELRLPEAPSFLSQSGSADARTHWMRLPRDVGDDPIEQAALLAYASDYFLLDMALRAHPDHDGPASFASTSLDHAMWFHRPTRFERWHRYTQEMVTLAGHRSLVRGAIYDDRGALVASVAQEVLVRSTRTAR